VTTAVFATLQNVLYGLLHYIKKGVTSHSSELKRQFINTEKHF